MTRTRPTMADWHKARDLEWYEAHAEWFCSLANGRWQVFASADAYNDMVYGEYGSLGEAIKAARGLVGDGDG